MEDPKTRIDRARYKQAERILIWMSDIEFWEFMQWCEKNKKLADSFGEMIELWAEIQTAVIQ